ncbi:unnamed protein product, partial [Oikopleura dioica]
FQLWNSAERKSSSSRYSSALVRQ